MEKARKVAIMAARDAGKLAKDRFLQEMSITEKGDTGDLVTVIDQLAEKRIIELIRADFPDHSIRGEEFGLSGADGVSDWLWLVDPLDGTNNYALGIPMYGVSITLMHKQNTVLGVIYDSHLDQLYVAEEGRGALQNGKLLTIKSPPLFHKLTVGWIQGHVVQKNAEAAAIKHRLEAEVKRVISLWAPSLLWCMLARGDIQGIVLYNSEGEDLYAGLLLAREAGACIVDFQGVDFTGTSNEPYLIACHPDRKDSFVRLVTACKSSL
ncbi:inositol monophosphatase family protein [Paenibacillus sp. GCM10027626]|uniref:inositol monophosphatase family protein n=1 Tax=Paenibacillus sp. GCM10027626 TaxID=3273411 RepID=UPI00363E2F54